MSTPGPGDTTVLLVVDHRESLPRLLGLSDDDPGALAPRLAEAKRVALDGLLRAAERSDLPRSQLGLLVDEELGADVAHAAADAGLRLAMPVERSGRRVIELEHGDEFARHIEAFEPDLIKALVRWNPGDDPDDKKRQARTLTGLAAWLHETSRTLLVELLVPPTSQDLDRVDGDPARYDVELRPELTRRAIREIRDLGVEVDVWQVEGVDDPEAAAELTSLIRDEGRDHVVALVLGDADDDRFEQRLRVAAPLAGVAGFAVGPPVWRGPLADHAAGRLDREQAVDRIATRLTDLLDVYLDAEAR